MLRMELQAAEGDSESKPKGHLAGVPGIRDASDHEGGWAEWDSGPLTMAMTMKMTV